MAEQTAVRRTNEDYRTDVHAAIRRALEAFSPPGTTVDRSVVRLIADNVLAVEPESAPTEPSAMLLEINKLIEDLDAARYNGSIYTYGQVQERLRIIAADSLVKAVQS